MKIHFLVYLLCGIVAGALSLLKLVLCACAQATTIAMVGALVVLSSWCFGKAPLVIRMDVPVHVKGVRVQRIPRRTLPPFRVEEIDAVVWPQ